MSASPARVAPASVRDGANEQRAVWLLALAGLAATAVATSLAAWVPLLPNNLFVPLLDLGKLTGYTWPSTFRFGLTLAAWFGVYGLGYALARRGGALALVLAFTAAQGLALLWAYPANAVDVFAYVADGRLLAVHHANPFNVAPNAYPLDVILPYLAFPAEPSQYGPLWALIGGAFTLLAHGSLPVEVLLYKALALAAQLGSTALVFLLARRLGQERRHAVAAALLFGWNPLLLWEMVGNAHNDGLMMLAGLAGLWCLVQPERRWLALPLILLGALVKLPVILLAPLVAMYLLRTGWRHLLVGGVLAGLLAAALYAPFWVGIDTITALGRTNLFTASLAEVARLLLAPQLGLPLAGSVASSVGLALFALLYLACLLRVLLRPGPRQVVAAGYVALLAFLLLAISWFQAWYVVWPAAVGVTLSGARQREVALLSLGAFGTYLVFIYLWVMQVVTLNPVQYAAVAVLLGPLLLNWLVVLATHRMVARRASRQVDVRLDPFASRARPA